MCRPARLKLRASGIQRSTDPAGGYVEACDLDIIGDETPASQQMYCQCLMLNTDTVCAPSAKRIQ
jgi:hypothetical protein